MKPDLTGIKNIVFDLGNVLLNLDFDASINAFKALGLDEKVVTRQQAYSDPVFYALETGQISAESFRERLRNILNNEKVADHEIDEAWYAMILDVPAHRVQMLQTLRKKYNIFLFSNTNEIHIGRFQKVFKEQHEIDFASLFEQAFYSHEIQARKPESESYKKVIKFSGIEPAESLFIDDLEKNILAANEAGLKTFWLRDGIDVTELF